MSIEKLKETQNTITVLVIFISKSLDIEILNNGTGTDTINYTFFDFLGK